MNRPELDPELIAQTEQALASFLVTQAEQGSASPEKALAGAKLLVICAGIAEEQRPPEDRISIHEEVARAFCSVGVDESKARSHADTLATRDMMRYCFTGPGSEITNKIDSNGYRPKFFLEHARKFTEEG